VDQWQPAQIQQLQEIGPYLQQEREQRGLTLEEVAEKTRIRPGLISALESAQTQFLPEPVYLRGFIKRYAELMGLDGEELASRLKLDPLGPIKGTATAHLDIPPSRKRLWARKGIAALAALTEGRWGDARGRSAKSLGQNSSSSASASGSFLDLLLQPLTWVVVGSVVLGIGLVYALGSRERSPSAQTPTPIPTESLVPSPKPQPEATIEPSPPPLAVAAATLPLKVNLEVKGDCWLQVVVDGEVVLEETVGAGRKLNWTAKDELKLTAGRPEAIFISINGSALAPFGAAGDAKEETFPLKAGG
jgi:transcriptional regulator with XRE-family HTH domain